MKVGLMVGEGSGAAAEISGVLERGQMVELCNQWFPNSGTFGISVNKDCGHGGLL